MESEADRADLARMRHPYAHRPLHEASLAADPFRQFRSWLADAVRQGLPEPNAMVLATAGGRGAPSARHVLLKELDEHGFVFFTNYASRKGTELAENPAASLCFPWFPIGRQVVVCGEAERVTRAESETYWRMRPRDAQIGAWASEQSRVIPSREYLESRVAEMERRFPDEVPLPDGWGGFRMVPETVEFWQGAPGRLHDRLRYRRVGPGWALERLAP